MKTFKEYLAESKRVYSFKIKVAGELPENFEKNVKAKLDKCQLATFEKIATTPVQELPLDFPELENKEVHIYDVVCEYPITPHEITAHLTEMGMEECCFKVRGSGEPSEVDQLTMKDELPGVAKLSDPGYTEDTVKIKHKDYFGNDFNKGFLKDLEKTAKERKKELGQDKGKPDVLGSAPKVKSKEGAKSPMGS